MEALTIILVLYASSLISSILAPRITFGSVRPFSCEDCLRFWLGFIISASALVFILGCGLWLSVAVSLVRSLFIYLLYTKSIY